MQLDNFITETIKSVVNGVTNLNDFAEQNNTMINPSVTDRFNNKMYTSGKNIGTREITSIRFKLNLVAAYNTNKKGEHTVDIITPDIENSHYYKTAPKVKFELNIVLPQVGKMEQSKKNN